MSPSAHQKLALGAFLAILIGVSWLSNPFFGLIAAGVFHKLVIQNLPVRCPACRARLKIYDFRWGYQEFPGRGPDTSTPESMYSCPSCGWEKRDIF